MKATARCLKEKEVIVSKKMIILIVISLCLLSNCFIVTCANIVQASEKIFFYAYPKGEYKPKIYAINTDGTNEIQLFDNDYYRAFPSVSKDGSKLAYIKWPADRTKFYLCISDIDGGNEHSILESTNDFISPNWSYDGKKLVIVQRNNSVYTGDTRDGDVYVINVDGSGLTNLTNNWDYQKHFAAFSPDGSKICFDKNETTWYAWPLNLFVMNADGSNQTKLTFHPNGDENKVERCNFSPNGQKIIYGKSSIWTINIDGTGNSQIPNTISNDSGPFYSPDGTKFVFHRLVNDYRQIVIASTDGSNMQVITNSQTHKENPSWAIISGVCTDVAVKPHNFTAGTSAKAAEVNANFDTLYQQINTQNCQIQALKAIVCHDHPTADVCK
ncbi:MAG: hypothetical protein WCH34_19560 [Bacteroidota bacterium]|jgi:Tol biopolymer transport system component